MDNDDYIVSLQKIDQYFLNSVPQATCFTCSKLFTLTDRVYVKVNMPYQPTIRFHDGKCMQEFTLGLYAFLKNRANMIEQGVMQ